MLGMQPELMRAAGPCDPPIVNPIACENSQTGNPESDWNIAGAGDDSIRGFATDISVNMGETVRFKVKTNSTNYRLDIYRLGYYGGLGARRVATVQPSASLPQSQPTCLTEASTGLIDCGNWAVSASWAIPANAVSGVYIAKLVHEDPEDGRASHVYFIVRDDDGRSDLLFQTADPTWQAYNSYDGASLYRDHRFGSPAGRGFKVSYNRPFITRADVDGLGQRSFLFNAEYPMIRWLEANGYNVSYFTGIDTDRRGAEIREHKVFLSVGHDEYWSAGQRANVEAARAAGVHLAFFSGNDVFWKTRWENSIDGSGTAHRTLVSYKETHANAKIDPNPAWTGTWRDPRFSPPADGGRPENALTGTVFTVNGPQNDAMTVPAADGRLRFWRNTSIATLPLGQTATLPEGVLGHEWNEDLDNGSRPAGVIRMSSTTLDVPAHIRDYGSTYGPGMATHSLALYRHASGALVFSAGTVQWPWGLDEDHDRPGTPADDRMRQATVNLLADMGVQPATLQPGLTPATTSTDQSAPTSTITSPAGGSTVRAGSPVTITGTATDAGGGVVGGVEVSVDGGTTWHPATGRASWSYTWTPQALGSATIRSRAADDSANLGTPGAGVTVTVEPRQCPCSIWNDSATSAVASHGDAQAVELGVKFRSDVDGYITGLRFYKGSANTGTHVGSLWTSAGARLASATFANETVSGWQQVLFAAPVAITANTTYIASYHAPNGGFALDQGYFTTAGVDNLPLRALRSGTDGGNGVYKYGPSSFPTDSFGASNYWVDVVFNTSATDAIPPAVTDRSPMAGATGVNVGATVTATFTESVNSGSISFVLRDPNNAAVPAAVGYDAATRTATLDPTALLAESATYTATVSEATDLAGNQMVPVSWSFTTTGPATNVWGSATPAVASHGDTQAVELGVKIRSDVDGYIAGVRFFKGAANTGTHVGSLWTSAGARLASATFANETVSGWQQVLFAAPVAITANTTYVASYHAPNGGFALDQGYFARPADVENWPLRAPRDGADGGNGVYKYGPSAFPTDTYQASNYWVDAVFSLSSTDTVAPTVIGQSPATGARVNVSTTVTATFSEPVGPSSISFVLRDPGNTAVPATVSYDAAARAATLDPAALLEESTTYSAMVSGATDATGNVMAPVNWSFSTPTCPCSLWDPAATPAVASHGDTQAVELGVKFRSDVDGYISGLRFYKGAANTGTHVGSLWTAAGAKLASATFAGETSTGWQQVLFAAPVAITANTTYVASYHAPNGGFALDQGAFAAADFVNVPLRALKSGADGGNGVYKYGPSAFPTDSYQATNYWVDVVFDLSGTDTLGPGISAVQAINITSTGATITWATDEAADSQVEYGTSATYGSSTTLDANRVTGHSQALTGLAPSTLHHYRVKSKDAAGSLTTSGDFTFTTVAALRPCPCSIWDDAATPAVPSQADSQAVELGVKFRSDVDGYISGIRFYKGGANTGTHLGSLWTSTGTKLAGATFANETAIGWQEVLFPAPVAITTNTTYVASYHAPNGGYAVNQGQFATSGVENAPLRALASGADGLNGLYRYGASGFPTESYQGSNYWVDVVFSTTAPPPPSTPTPTPTPAPATLTPTPTSVPPTVTPTPTAAAITPTPTSTVAANTPTPTPLPATPTLTPTALPATPTPTPTALPSTPTPAPSTPTPTRTPTVGPG